MNTPTDGHGIYEGFDFYAPGVDYRQRLNQIASGGFKLVMNYNILFLHSADIVAYVNYAASVGLKIIVALNKQNLWDGTDISTIYPFLSAESGGCTTGACLVPYVIGLVQNLPGLWGYYVGDEQPAANHALLKVNADLIKATDPAHPRLFICGGVGVNPPNNCWKQTSPYFDCAEVIGDDWYPLSFTAANTLGMSIQTTGIAAANIQQFTNTHHVQPAMVLQTFAWNEYPNPICSPWPTCSTFPTRVQLRQVRDLCLTNMQPRVLMWYSFFDVLGSDNPIGHWADLVWAVSGQTVPSGSSISDAGGRVRASFTKRVDFIRR